MRFTTKPGENRAIVRWRKIFRSFSATRAASLHQPGEANDWLHRARRFSARLGEISMQTVKKGFAHFLALSLVAVPLLAACSGSSGGGSTGTGTGSSSGSGGSSGGGSSSGGGGGGTNSGGGGGGSSSSSASCCLGSSYYDCPSGNDADSCLSKGDPGACTRNSSEDKKCCSSSGFSCSSGSECCSGSCVQDPENPDDTVCQ